VPEECRLHFSATACIPVLASDHLCPRRMLASTASQRPHSQCTCGQPTHRGSLPSQPANDVLRQHSVLHASVAAAGRWKKKHGTKNSTARRPHKDQRLSPKLAATAASYCTRCSGTRAHIVLCLFDAWAACEAHVWTLYFGDLSATAVLRRAGQNT
jgi:hypothetical protein